MGSTQITVYYLVSETDGTRFRAGTSEAAARIRLMHAQANSPFARYTLTSALEAPIPQWIDGVGIVEEGH